MAANQAILDATIRHAVFLEKLKAGEVGKFAPFLKEIDRSIRDRLTRSDLTEYNVKRLEALLKEVDSLLLGILDRYSTQLNLDLVDIANYEAEFGAASLARSAPVGVSLDVAAPTVAAVRTAVLTNPLSVRGTGGGKLLKAFIKGWTTAERERVTGTIRQGLFEGQTNFKIIRNIRGTKAAGYKDGILATTSRNASTVVHTAIQHVSSQARMEVAKANTDIVSEVEMVATLDSKTSQTCRSMDKRRFPVDSGLGRRSTRTVGRPSFSSPSSVRFSPRVLPGPLSVMVGPSRSARAWTTTSGYSSSLRRFRTWQSGLSGASCSARAD
ncbi:hypothetical protein PBOI14_48790 [Pseudomonas sp. Boi14]|nr:hypothetical protein PBOI14_48790 [Pseudomonas sp. Boi14]